MSIRFLLFLCHQILISMFLEVVNQAEFLHVCYRLSFPMLGWSQAETRRVNRTLEINNRFFRLENVANNV